MISGLNLNANAELEAVVMLTSQQLDIPPANAKVGGTNSASTIPFMPVGNLLITGMIGVTLMVTGGSTQAGESFAPIEISVVPPEPNLAESSHFDLREAYEHLRQKMLSEGIPFLNATELDREIADRKGTRS